MGLPLVKRATELLPHEIWEKIRLSLPDLSPNSFAETLRISFRPNRRKHCRVWDEIFENYDWLHKMTALGFEPMLVGADLAYLYDPDVNNADGDDIPIYLILLCGENWPTRKAKTTPVNINVRSLEESLRPFESKLRQPFHGEESEELVFHHKNIRLHVGDFYRNQSWSKLPISRPSSLFSGPPLFKLGCSYLYWKGDYNTLRQATEIIGEGLAVSTKQSVSTICGLTLHRPEKGLRGPGKWQQIFINSADRFRIRDELFKEIKQDPTKRSSRGIGWERKL